MAHLNTVATRNRAIARLDSVVTVKRVGREGVIPVSGSGWRVRVIDGVETDPAEEERGAIDGDRPLDGSPRGRSEECVAVAIGYCPL